jgi:hypothetical protein
MSLGVAVHDTDQAEPAHGGGEGRAPGVERRVRPLRSFELRPTARELRSALQLVEFRLVDEVDPATRRELRLVIGELVARWLQCAGASEPMIITVRVLPDRVRLDVAAPTADRGPEFWTRVCDAPGLGLSRDAHPERRSDSGVFIELPRRP